MFVWSLCKVLARAGDGALCVLSKGLGDCLRVLFAGFCGVGLGGFVPHVVFSVDTKRGHGEWVIYDL